MSGDSGHTNQSRPRSVGILVLVQAVLCCSYLGLVAGYPALKLTVNELIYPASLFAVGLIAWSIWSWRAATGALFDPYLVFFVAAALFNAGLTLLEVLHLNERGFLGRVFSPETTLRTIFLATIGLAFFHLGGLLSATFANRGLHSPRITKVSQPAELVAVRIIGWVLLGLSIVPWGYQLAGSLNVVLSEGYSALYRQEASTGLGAGPQILADYLVPAAIFMVLGSKGRGIDLWVATALIAANTLMLLFFGNRSAAIMPVIAYAWAYHRAVRRIPGVVLAVGGSVLMFVVFPLLPVIRNISGQQRMSLSFLWDSYVSVENPMVAIIAEMGGSMRTISYTLELVPAYRPHDAGVGYLYGLSTLVPNFFWDVHPAIERGLPGKWLTSIVDPYTASHGGSVGYSFIAEAYLNFGWLGTPLTLMVLGIGFAALSRWANASGDVLKIAVVASFLSFVPHYAREDASGLFRPLVWYGLIPATMTIVLLELGRRQATKGIRGERNALAASRPLRTGHTQVTGRHVAHAATTIESGEDADLSRHAASAVIRGVRYEAS